MSSVSTLKCLLVADDLTDGGSAAIHRAASLPFAARAELHLLHVVETALGAARGEASRQAADTALRALEARAAAASALVREVSPGHQLSVATHVRHGQPFVEIIREARAVGADLVVVGRHRRRRVADAWIGSTAEREVRKGDVPVLVTSGQEGPPYERVVAAVDLGDASRAVVELAAALAPPRCGLTMVHAYGVAFEGELGPATRAELGNAREREAQRAAEPLRELTASLGLDYRLVVRRGDPRVAVAREVLRQRANLLVTGTHARSGVAHALLGSVAEWLVRAAPCDVAVTRPAHFTFELP
jgi:nucleotide-binding universal stress UspA family protein